MGVGLGAVTSPSGSGGEIRWSFGVSLSGQSERLTNVTGWHPVNECAPDCRLVSSKVEELSLGVDDGSCIKLTWVEEPAGVGKHVTEDSHMLH